MKYKFLVTFLFLLTLNASVSISAQEESLATSSHEEQKPKKIIIVATAWAIAKYIKSAVNGLGYEPVILADMKGYSPQVANDVRQCEWYDVDVSSYENAEKFLEESLGTIWRSGRYYISYRYEIANRTSLSGEIQCTRS